MKISAVIIVKNAEQTIRATLEGLKAFDEVLIYDNGSTDKTLLIAEEFVNVKIVKGQFIGFGETKNSAASFARNDWVLSIDSDEVVSPMLLNSIQSTNIQKDTVYGFERFNYYRKKRVRFSGWQKEIIYRLYNKNTTEFNHKKVHEGLKLDNIKTSIFKGELKHYSYLKISDFNRKRALYSDLFASENIGKRKSSPLRAVISGMYDFLITYFFRLGFLDGYRGLLISFSNSSVTFLKYLKLYEANLNNNLNTSLIITTCNGVAKLERVLKSVLYQAIPPDELIINDDGTFDEVHLFIENFAKSSFIPIKYILQDRESINETINKTKFEYLIYIEDHVVLDEKFISDHISHAQKGHFVTGRNIVPDKKQSGLLFNNDDNLLEKPDMPNYIKSLIMAFVANVFKRKAQLPKHKHISCSFHKTDYLSGGNNKDNALKTITFIDELEKKGLKRINLSSSAIQYLPNISLCDA